MSTGAARDSDCRVSAIVGLYPISGSLGEFSWTSPSNLLSAILVASTPLRCTESIIKWLQVKYIVWNTLSTIQNASNFSRSCEAGATVLPRIVLRLARMFPTPLILIGGPGGAHSCFMVHVACGVSTNHGNSVFISGHSLDQISCR